MSASKRRSAVFAPLDYREAGSAAALEGLDSLLEHWTQPAENERTTANKTLPVNERSPVSERYPVVERNTVKSPPGRSAPRRCVVAQDGHSLGEQAVYQFLWLKGDPEGADPNGSRLVRKGASEIADAVRIHKLNVLKNLARLVEKLSLEIVDRYQAESRIARQYRVFSYQQILERRRAKGMEYVLRNKGVQFCTAEGVPLSYTVCERYTVDERSTVNVSDPGDERFAVYEKISAAWPVDAAAGDRLIAACRERNPRLTPEELLFAIEEKIAAVGKNRKIYNPTGFLLATLPLECSGEDYPRLQQRLRESRDYRRQVELIEEQRREDLQRWIERERMRLERIASDLSLPEEERLRAEQELRRNERFFSLS